METSVSSNSITSKAVHQVAPTTQEAGRTQPEVKRGQQRATLLSRPLFEHACQRRLNASLFNLRELGMALLEPANYKVESRKMAAEVLAWSLKSVVTWGEESEKCLRNLENLRDQLGEPDRTEVAAFIVELRAAPRTLDLASPLAPAGPRHDETPLRQVMNSVLQWREMGTGHFQVECLLGDLMSPADWSV